MSSPRTLLLRALVALSAAILAATNLSAASVLVSDTNNNRVVAYTISGTTWTQTGVFATGSYNGTALTLPLGMARDASGSVYIAEERDTGRILRFSASGAFLNVVATEGTNFAGRPEALTLGPDGNLYMSVAFGTVSDRIYKVNLTTNAVTVFVPTTGTGYTLNNPRGIGFASDGNLYVADRNAAIGGNAATDAVRVFDGNTGAFISNLATPDNPHGLSWDAVNNRLLVSVFGNADIMQYTLDGTATKIYDQSAAKSYLDIKAIEGEVYFTRYEDGRIDRITGLTTTQTVATGLSAPGHILVLSASTVTPPTPCLALIPGTAIDYSPASSAVYLGSPSIAILADGSYVASHDTFGSGSTLDRTFVFRSTNGGLTWQARSQVVGQYWSTLFTLGSDLYLIGTSKEYGTTVIRKSTDSGATWSAGTNLLSDTPYHCAPVPVVVQNGRVWRAMEDAMGGGGWPRQFRAFMMSAPVTADLLNAANWTFSNRLASSDTWLGTGVFNGWLEGNAVVTPSGGIVDILRADVNTPAEKAAIVQVSADGTQATFDPATNFVDFPGGAKKFTIRYDPQSSLYWSLSNYVPPQHASNTPGSVRNTLALISSPDLANWTVRTIVLYNPNVSKDGFQYVDWQFDGNDLVTAIRTAFDDGLGGANDYHNANFLMFKRIANFRQLTSADSVPFSTVTRETVGATIKGSGFEIGRFDNGELAFSNRTYVWQGIPAAYQGWQFTRTAGNALATITVTAKTADFVYVATAPSQAGPDLTGWETVTGATFSYNDGANTALQIYRHSVGAGDTLQIPQGNFTGTLVLSPDPFGLLGWWRFSETCGLTVRDTANGFDGLRSANGTNVVSGGVSGNALSIDASAGGYVAFGNRFTFASGSFSFAAWIKMNPGDTTSPSYVLSKYTPGGTGGYFLSVNPTQGIGTAGKAVFYTGGTGTSPVSQTSVNDGRWHHIVSRYQAGGSQTIYVDGAPVEATGAASAIPATADQLVLGGSMVGGIPHGAFTGLVDEVQIYDRVLNDSEIDFLFRHPGESVRPNDTLRLGVPVQLQMSSTSGTQPAAVLSWSSLPGFTYKVFRKQSLLDPNWTVLSSPLASDVQTTFSDPIVFPAAFYYVDIIP